MKNREFMMLQLFANDNNAYCDFSSTAAKALAGKDILLAIWNDTGDKLLAISGQQDLRSTGLQTALRSHRRIQKAAGNQRLRV